MAFKTGDRVKIVSRQATSADSKSGLFYDYFGGLVGTVEHVYEDNTASIAVDLDSLPEDVQQRHAETTEAVRQRWLKGMSGEARDRLTEKEKEVQLAYNILVNMDDLEPGPKASKTPKASNASGTEAKRKTEADIAKAEEEYLKSVASGEEPS